MKTNDLPAVIMLTAGAIDCVLSICAHVSLFDFTKQLLLVLVIFYVLGCIVKWILDINFPQMDENSEAEDQESEDNEAETEEASNVDETLENIDEEEKESE